MAVTLPRAISTLMHREPVTLDLGATITEAAAVMTEQEVGSVLVTEMGQLVGIVTEHDVVVALWDSEDLSSSTVGDVMSESPFVADPSDEVALVLERMVSYGVQHMPVVEGGRAVGIVSSRDILRALAEQEYWREPAEDEPES